MTGLRTAVGWVYGGSRCYQHHLAGQPEADMMVSGEGTSRGSAVTFIFLSLFVHCAFSVCSPASFMCSVHCLQSTSELGCVVLGVHLALLTYSYFCLFGCFQLQSYDCSLQPVLLLCFIVSSYLQQKSALSAALPDLGGKTTGCRNLPSDSDFWGTGMGHLKSFWLNGFPKFTSPERYQEASNHHSLESYLFLQCCVVDLLPICPL